MSDPVSPAAYARTVEAYWSGLAGRPVVLSPRDWFYLTRWHDEGVPLEIIREAMDAAAERRRGADPFRALSSLARAVEESFRVIVDGRLSEAGEDADPVPSLAASEAWTAVAARLEADSELAAVLRELSRRYDDGEPPAELDAELDRRLPEIVEPGLCERARCELDEQIRPFRSRMSSLQISEVSTRGLVERLRSAIGLPRLAVQESGE